MENSPIGVLVTVVGISSPDCGARCEHHAFCGKVLHLDSVLRLRKKVIELGMLT